jgi:hypothetical protein
MSILRFGVFFILVLVPSLAAASPTVITATGGADAVRTGGAAFFTAPGGVSVFLGDGDGGGLNSWGQEWLPGTTQTAHGFVGCCDTGSFTMDDITYITSHGCLGGPTCFFGSVSFSGTLQVPTPQPTDPLGQYVVTFPAVVSGDFTAVVGCPLTGCPSITFSEDAIGSIVLNLTTNIFGQPIYRVGEFDVSFPAVPEPSTWLLVVSGLITLIIMRYFSRSDDWVPYRKRSTKKALVNSCLSGCFSRPLLVV